MAVDEMERKRRLPEMGDEAYPAKVITIADGEQMVVPCLSG
jgi:hypothetical protein